MKQTPPPYTVRETTAEDAPGLRALAAAELEGVVALNATIRADNVGGLAFYSTLGFVDYAIERDVPLSCGALVDRVSKRHALVPA